MSAPTLKTMRDTYSALWQRLEIAPDRQAGVAAAARRVLAGKARYQAVAASLGLPKATGWAFIGLIHYRESNCNFHCHLHNGDPLTARTVQVPAGRPLPPLEPPFTWEESAADALRMRGISELVAELQTLEGLAYASEGYNGWGYYWHDHLSPYLLAGSTECPKGKYDRDSHYNANLVDPQEGVLCVLKALMTSDPSITFSPATALQPAPEAAPEPKPATPVVVQKQPTTEAPESSVVHTIALLFSTLTGMFTSVAQAVDVLKPYLQHPAVVGAIVAALAAAGIIVWREHHAHATA